MSIYNPLNIFLHNIFDLLNQHGQNHPLTFVYYNYYNKELKIDYNDIKYITVTSRNNLDMNISNINSYIKNHINSHKKTDNNRNKKQKTDYDQAKWLTGC